MAARCRKSYSKSSGRSFLSLGWSLATERHSIGLSPEVAVGLPGLAEAIVAATAVDHLTLAAAAQGLGTCWIGAFDEEKVKGLLGIPQAASKSARRGRRRRTSRSKKRTSRCA